MNKKSLGIVLLIIGVFLALAKPAALTGFAIFANNINITFTQIISSLFIILGIVLVTAEDIRHSRQGIPAGTFYAPDFYVKRDTNHGDGYHAHLYRTKDNQRTSIRICYDGQKIYVEEHGRGIPVSLDRAVDFIRNNAVDQVEKKLGVFHPKDLAKPTSKARVVPG